MALEIFKLFGSIYVDNEKANESLTKTDSKAQNVGSTLLKGVGTAAKWGAGIATAAGAGVAALTGMASKVADTASAIKDSADRAGLTAEEYQKYAHAANMSGIEVSKLDALMIKSQKSFADASTGSKAMSEAYKKLGIDINSIGDSSEAFDTTIAALADMEDITQRNALANDIFGKSYADLAPLLNEGSSGIAALKQEAVDMGMVMSNDAVAAGEEFGDTLDKIKGIGAGLFNSLGSELIPIAQQFADMLIANLPMIQELFAQLSPVIATVFGSLLPPVMELVQTFLPPMIELFTSLIPIITDIITNILPIFTELLNLLLPPLMGIVQELLPPLLEIIMALMPVFQTVIDLLKPILDLFLQLLDPILDLVTDAIAPLMTKLAEFINVILEPIIPIIETLAEILGDTLGTAFEVLSPIIDDIIGVFGGLIDFISGVFTGDWELAFQGIQDIVKNIFEGMVNIVKAPINFIINGINAFIRGINKVKIPDWVPAVGGKGINIPEIIPLLENGGTIYKKGSAIVGEAGAELLELPTGAKVTPLTSSEKTIGKEAKAINLNLNLNIENFNNSSDKNIEELSEMLAFQTMRKIKGGGLAYV